MSNGLIHLYHGDGKGKTTAAMGLAVRALGCGRRVVIVQFLKGGATGELEPLQTLGTTFYRGKAGQKFVFQMNEEEKAATRALQTENLRRALAEPADLLILDEACAAWNLNMVDRELLQNAVLHKPAEQELAMSGFKFIQCSSYCHFLLRSEDNRRKSFSCFRWMERCLTFLHCLNCSFSCFKVNLKPFLA